ncbi:MAG: undecaprenyl-diphosphate phosphatase [Clostridiales bacterium]|nr:undecaprenyl-diphosphate phosphatase [Clostridiales bacterium]
MTIWIALLLGVVQGLCEFLPVSSSGHLLLLSKLFGVEEGGAFFTVMLHLATLVAVCIVYRKTLWELLKKPIQKLTGMLILATVPTVIFALLLKKVAGGFYADMQDGSYLGVAFLLTSVLLLICDALMAKGAEGRRDLSQIKVKDALIIGGMQCIGVFPGVSRSGSTITSAVSSGLDRKAAADFSFLMSIPAILGGLVLEAWDAKDAILAGNLGVPIPALLVGMLAAGLTGYFAVRFMIRLITKRKLWGFAIYTALLGAAVIVLQLIGKV